jgi:hypothetical protein
VSETLDIGPEIQAIKDKILAISDPLERVIACADIYQTVADDLVKWLGPNGQRGQAAREAKDKYHTVRLASEKSGVTEATLRRLMGW